MAIFFGKRDEETKGAQKVIGEEDVRRGTEILAKYKAGKQRLEEKIVENEKWWKLQHWDVMRKEEGQLQSATAWLFSMLTSKHADAMDNFPEPMVLPRELSDKDAAKTLSQVLPVVLENCGYHNVYSMQWWEKLKHGTGVYGGFWDSSIDNGLGDVTVTGLDLLNLFWEPGINHIQRTRNLFITALWDTDILTDTFPEAEGKIRGDAIDVKKYIHDENIDVSEKTVVVDWYYRTKSPAGKTVIHLIKFAAGVLLYASENDPRYKNGWIEDDKYPVEFDVLFPEKDMPTGFGFIDVLRNPQEYIDRIYSHIIESSIIGTKKRYLASKSTNINIEQFKNIEEPIVEVEGEISDARIKEIVPTPVSGTYLNVLQMMIEGMKDTSHNRDVNNGSASGATAAAAIAALQEAGNKQSRDMIDASYRAQENVYRMCIERMRQHYDETRSFRIMGGGTPEGYEFVSLDPSVIRDQVTGKDADGNNTYRHPIFDLKVKAQKKNPFSRMEQNERAKELYGLGFFNPERAQEATVCIGMMDFEGKDEILEQIKQGQTLLNICQQQQQQLAQMQQMLAAITGGLQGAQNPPVSGGASAPQSLPADAKMSSENSLASGIMEAHTPMTSYGEQLAKRSTPSLE